MATFNYTVDTQPMAEEMKRVSQHVNVTTGAVVAMQTAVVAAEGRAAEHVCKNVNRGFYSLIRSQISQKLAKLQSEVDSNFMQLEQQKHALLGIKNRMQRDYNMIARRYLKLFNGLNANLKNRIFELEKPTIDFACREIEKISNRTKYLTAVIPVSQSESISISQRIVSSNVKKKGFVAINSMKSFIHEMNIQKNLTDRILIQHTGILSVGKSYLPIILYECNRDKTGQNSIEIVLSEVELTPVTRSSIKNAAYRDFQQLKWVQTPERSSEVTGEFTKMVAASDKPTRIKEMTLRLFQSNKYQTI